MDIKQFKKKTKIKCRVDKNKYAVAKVSSLPKQKVFAVISDKNEITVIHNQNTKLENVLEVEKDFRLLTFDMTLPFDLVGFMAYISKLLADENISIFTISAYSTDHILLKNKDLGKAISVFEQNGVEVNKA